MHILVVFEYGSINGGENSFLAVVDQLRENGWTFTALVLPDTPLERLLHARDFSTLPLANADQNGTRLTQADRRELIADAIRAAKPDLVHANSLSMGRLCGPVCRSLGVPSLGYLRDIIKISRKAMDDINQLDRIVAVSNATRDFHLERGLDSDRSLTIYNGINPASSSIASQVSSDETQSSIRTDLNLPANAQLLLSVGQIGMRKGLDTLIEGIVELAANRLDNQPPLHLLIVGQRHSQKQEAVDYETRLHERVKEAGLERQVHWLGRRDDVADLMRQSTLLLHAARQEPLGRVLLEAGSLGLPIIATDVGGTAEILAGPALTKCLIPKDDPESLAQAADNLLNDGSRWLEISQRLRKTICERFSVSQCAKQLHDQYAALVAHSS